MGHFLGLSVVVSGFWVPDLCLWHAVRVAGLVAGSVRVCCQGAGSGAGVWSGSGPGAVLGAGLELDLRSGSGSELSGCQICVWAWSSAGSEVSAGFVGFWGYSCL